MKKILKLKFKKNYLRIDPNNETFDKKNLVIKLLKNKDLQVESTSFANYYIKRIQ